MEGLTGGRMRLFAVVDLADRIRGWKVMPLQNGKLGRAVLVTATSCGMSVCSRPACIRDHSWRPRYFVIKSSGSIKLDAPT
jgi:hypothetical protein